MGDITSSNSKWIKNKVEMTKKIHLMELKGYGVNEIRKAEAEIERYAVKSV